MKKEGGKRKKAHLFTSDERWVASIHEAGHAMVLYKLHPTRLVSVVVRSRLCYNKDNSQKDRGLVNIQDFLSSNPKEALQELAFRYGGYVAEKELLGEVSEDNGEDLANAVEIAYKMVCMDAQVSCTGLWPPTSFHKLRELGIKLEPETDDAIRVAMRKILKRGHALARRVVRNNRKDIQRLAQYLYDHPDKAVLIEQMASILGHAENRNLHVVRNGT